MLSYKKHILISLFCLLLAPLCLAKEYSRGCCENMGGVNYCDSSAGRLVCNNGFYSTCYCTPHAIMDLQFLQGCCLWRGGVMGQNLSGPNGLIVCNDGSVSEECSQNPTEKVAAW